MATVTVTGLAGSCGQIVELAANCVTSLREANRRFQTTNFTTTILISHLSTLKAALMQVQQWISSELFASALHYQLIMDVDAALACCHLLLGFMNERISKLSWDSTNVLEFTSKARVILEESSTKDCITHLSHQSVALNLLLTAFQCQTQAEQSALLKNKSSRQIFNQIRDDSSSLIVLRDEESVKTRGTHSTGASSKLSLVFGFDSQLFQTRVYQNNFRSFLRRATRSRTDSKVPVQTTNILAPRPDVFVSQLHEEAAHDWRVERLNSAGLRAAMETESKRPAKLRKAEVKRLQRIVGKRAEKQLQLELQDEYNLSSEIPPMPSLSPRFDENGPRLETPFPELNGPTGLPIVGLMPDPHLWPSHLYPAPSESTDAEIDELQSLDDLVVLYGQCVFGEIKSADWENKRFWERKRGEFVSNGAESLFSMEAQSSSRLGPTEGELDEVYPLDDITALPGKFNWSDFESFTERYQNSSWLSLALAERTRKEQLERFGERLRDKVRVDRHRAKPPIFTDRNHSRVGGRRALEAPFSNSSRESMSQRNSSAYSAVHPPSPSPHEILEVTARDGLYDNFSSSRQMSSADHLEDATDTTNTMSSETFSSSDDEFYECEVTDKP